MAGLIPDLKAHSAISIQPNEVFVCSNLKFRRIGVLDSTHFGPWFLGKGSSRGHSRNRSRSQEPEKLST
jgi:hypothetical protein